MTRPSRLRSRAVTTMWARPSIGWMMKSSAPVMKTIVWPASRCLRMRRTAAADNRRKNRSGSVDAASARTSSATAPSYWRDELPGEPPRAPRSAVCRARPLFRVDPFAPHGRAVKPRVLLDEVELPTQSVDLVGRLARGVIARQPADDALGGFDKPLGESHPLIDGAPSGEAPHRDLERS